MSAPCDVISTRYLHHKSQTLFEIRSHLGSCIASEFSLVWAKTSFFRLFKILWSWLMKKNWTECILAGYWYQPETGQYIVTTVWDNFVMVPCISITVLTFVSQVLHTTKWESELSFQNGFHTWTLLIILKKIKGWWICTTTISEALYNQRNVWEWLLWAWNWDDSFIIII